MARASSAYHSEADVQHAPFRYVDTSPRPVGRKPVRVWRNAAITVLASVVVPIAVGAALKVLYF